MFKHNEIRNDIWNTVMHLTDKQINQQEASDRWSIAQILEHLYLIEDSITQKMIQHLKMKTEKPIVKPVQLTLDRSRKLVYPIPISDEFRTLNSLRKKLNNSRHAFELLIKGLTADQLAQKSMNHPVFGEAMSFYQWVEFVGLHEERHLEQINEVKTNLHFP
ncbi:DinB family protein [Shimazuella sp. AN120528]|uniref:DinB family protein n=1 Tax=Shimazuella soli TaxID=1892854 RepID=UPI001F0D89CF|nr:DinB family protein [Shimazuella soli]MCH5585587.1 DinB family protein [Shimazuella soli]